MLSAILVVLGVCIGPLINDREYYFLQSPLELSRTLFGANPLSESTLIAAYLRDRTAPGEPVLILGSEPQILVLADRPSATRHLFMYQVVGPYRRAKEFQQQLLDDMERKRPNYVVYINLPLSWFGAPGSNRAFPLEILDNLKRNYSVEAIMLRSSTTPHVIELGPLSKQEQKAEIDRARIVIFRRDAPRGSNANPN